MPPPPGVELLDVRRVRLVEAAAPEPPPWERLAMDRLWDEAVLANPSLFDGPVAACAGLAREGPHGVVVTWARTTYRRYALRWVPGATARLPALFVDVVQPTEDGRLLVGRMGRSTSAPGRWLLPGGSVEPPGEGRALDLAALRGHAARELAEETGVESAPGELRLWLVTRGAHGGVGVLFLAPPRPAALLRERFAALVSAEKDRGREPELDRITLVGSPAELAELTGPGADLADYLVPVMTRYAADALLGPAPLRPEQPGPAPPERALPEPAPAGPAQPEPAPSGPAPLRPSAPGG
ncbi:NUDIX hydrolase [Streptomyces flavofungini]|uniref:NUDIX hydrolase n=1 Tax=Streptomyces flavofungini TaxID=68200 RepID=UPI0025B229EF|nr:NUDIX domain-containing protein [Streptomyces flavofungini]WJV44353.1 NUDIX domain-containing protein [Streptomyces flavofungini]